MRWCCGGSVVDERPKVAVAVEPLDTPTWEKIDVENTTNEMRSVARTKHRREQILDRIEREFMDPFIETAKLGNRHFRSTRDVVEIMTPSEVAFAYKHVPFGDIVAHLRSRVPAWWSVVTYDLGSTTISVVRTWHSGEQEMVR